MELLSDDAKQTIRMEEAYRAEIRAQAAGLEKKPHTSFSSFFESTLGKALLTSVLLPVAGTAYKAASLRLEEQQKVKERHARMRFEVGHRYSTALIRLYEISDTDTHRNLKAGHTAEEVKQILDDFANGTNSKVVPLYSDLQGTTATAMVAELADCQTVHKEGSNQVITPLCLAVSDLSGITIMQGVKKAGYDHPGEVARVLEKRFDLFNFENGNFYFSDCRGSDPFC